MGNININIRRRATCSFGWWLATRAHLGQCVSVLLLSRKGKGVCRSSSWVFLLNGGFSVLVIFFPFYFRFLFRLVCRRRRQGGGLFILYIWMCDSYVCVCFYSTFLVSFYLSSSWIFFVCLDFNLAFPPSIITCIIQQVLLFLELF